MKIIKHFNTISRHRYLVRKYCFKVGLYYQGLTHDLSKYSFKEFFISAKYYSGQYSPINNERNDKGYSEVWLHHKGRNKHHPEYWLDVDKDKKFFGPQKMPKKYLVEMVLDRISAARVYNKKNYSKNKPLEYLERTKHACPMHEETLNELIRLLKLYQELEEKEFLKYLRRYLKKSKNSLNY